MVGILIITHGTLGESILHSASNVMGGRPAHLTQIDGGLYHETQVIMPQGEKVMPDRDNRA